LGGSSSKLRPIFGKIKGPIIAIILFGFWMELSMGIMLYGAKLTYIFDKQKGEKDAAGNENENKQNGSESVCKYSRCR
jgi:uncharacterized BrkB/YihY/UPF0761 family membrane protein